MKRLLSVILVLLLLTGCSPAGGSSSHSSTPPQSTVSSGSVSSGAPDQSGSTSSDPQPPEISGWQKAYLDLLNSLSAEFGRFVQPEESHLPVSGLKYARLLDFNADGVRELIVLIDNTVRLYTCREDQAALLYEGVAGGRFGQTDVGSVFHINAQGFTPCLVLYHTQREWTEEAITIVHLTGEGNPVVTELYAAVPENGWDEEEAGEPGREHLSGFTINGEEVSAEVYDAARLAALDDSITLDVYVQPDFTTSVTEALLDQLFYILAHWDGFLLPDVDARRYTEDELRLLTARELRLARNEIYARHGRTFGAADLKAHFQSKDWYLPTYSGEEFDAIAVTLLNKYELDNLTAILAVERSGDYEQNAEVITPEEALDIAETYWNYHEGMLDPDTGYLTTLSAEAITDIGEGSYYIFRLRLLENNDHWVIKELLYVDAHTGTTSTILPE